MTAPSTPQFSVLSNWAGNWVVTNLLKGPHWLAAHTADPTPLGKLDTEVAGGGYQRQPIIFTRPSGRGTVSSNKQRFAGMPACRVTHLAVWTAVSGGNLVFTVWLGTTDGDGPDTIYTPQPIDVRASAALEVPPGDVGLQL